jgi:hypothetical protein
MEEGSRDHHISSWRYRDPYGKKLVCQERRNKGGGDGNRTFLQRNERVDREGENSALKFVQINLHHRKAAKAVICQQLLREWQI